MRFSLWPFRKRNAPPTAIRYREVFDPRSETIRAVLTDAFVHHEEIGAVMCIWVTPSGDGARISIVGLDGQVTGFQVAQLLHCAAHGADLVRRSM